MKSGDYVIAIDTASLQLLPLEKDHIYQIKEVKGIRIELVEIRNYTYYMYRFRLLSPEEYEWYVNHPKNFKNNLDKVVED